MPETITITGLKARAQRFRNCRSLEELALLLGKPALQLLALAENPAYDEFRMPKKDGGMRDIEDPWPPLKKVQRKLNDYFQAVYHFHRTDAAYGFITNPKDDPAPRHILSNAQVHVGCRYLLNVDLRDFFHQITEEHLLELFRKPIFGFSSSLSEFLTALCTHKGRLPMGAPTSPVLTNLVCIPLDHELQHYAQEQGWKYTRYADDLSFSARTGIELGHIQEIKLRLERYGLEVNPKKVRLYDATHTEKEVTGLIVLQDRVDLPEDYIAQLEQAISHLDRIFDAKYSIMSGRRESTGWLTELEQQIRGKLEYARQILGEDDLQYLDLRLRLETALMPPEEYGPLGWLDFGYRL